MSGTRSAIASLAKSRCPARVRCIARIAPAVVLLASTSEAQQVTGMVRVRETKLPSAESSVLLLNVAGEIAAVATTAVSGRFTVVAPARGRYRVIARRLGFVPDSSKWFDVQSANASVPDLALASLTNRLPVVSRNERERCVVAGEAGAAAFRLWQAAQDALAATSATTMRVETGYTLRRFERERDPVSGRVVRSREWDVRSMTSDPFASTSADSLAALGFARSVAGGAMYYAPDVRTLLSDAFARTHCFRPRDEAERPGAIGLAFEPVGSRNVYDVGGVLWLDRATSELREIDYRYVEAKRPDEREPTATATGELTFRRIANGAWIVNAWAVRVPVTRVASRVTPRQGEQLGATMAVDRTAVSVVRGMFEFGGAVTSVFDARDTTAGALSSFGSVRGVVSDSLTHQGVVGLPVVILADSTTTFRTTTGTRGEFAFDSLPGGDYVLRLPVARFDTTNTPIDPVSLSIAARTQMTVSIVVPPTEAGIAGLCRQVPPRSVVVHGVVRDSATGAPASGARVLAYWLEATSRNDELLKAIPHERTTVADASGRYVFCDLPDWHRFLLSASAGPRSNTAPAPAVQPTRDRIRMLDLQLHDRSIDPLQAVR